MRQVAAAVQLCLQLLIRATLALAAWQVRASQKRSGADARVLL